MFKIPLKVKLNSYTEYAFRILLYLLMNKEKRVKVQDIADYYSASLNHFNKVVQKLSKLGYIKTSRGKNGGVLITQEGEEVTLDKLILQMEPPEELAQCSGGSSHVECRLASHCKLRQVFQSAQTGFYAHLRDYKIKDLV